MAIGTKSMPSASCRLPKVKRLSPVKMSRPTVASSRPMAAAMSALVLVPLLMVATSRMPSSARAEYSGGPKSRAKLGHDRGQEGQADDGGGAADEGADGGHAERGAGLALFGHLVAVEDGDHRASLAGEPQQHGGDGAAVLGAVEDAGQHDDGGDGLDVVGERQQDGDGGRGPQAGQHADQHADDDADQAVQEVRRLQDNGKSVDHGIQKIHGGLLEEVGNGGVERQDEDAVERRHDDGADQRAWSARFRRRGSASR